MSNRIKYLKYDEYQTLAHSFLKSVDVNSNSQFPFEIDLLADKAGYKIKPVSNLKKDLGVKGCVLKFAGGIFQIAIDDKHYMDDEFYYPVTIAEELGHILAHDYIYENINSLKEAIDFHSTLNEQEYRMMEQQARNVGSNILIPSFLLKSFLIGFCKKQDKKIRRNKFDSKEDLAEFIAYKISPILKISKNVVFYALKRYPDRAIDTVVISHFGNSIFK